MNALQNEGRVDRVRGGAVLLAQDVAEQPDMVSNEAGKKRMAKRAAEMVRNGDAIWLDAGTSVQMMIPLLKNRSNLTIVTNGLRVALQLAEQDRHQVLLIGGRFFCDVFMGSIFGSFTAITCLTLSCRVHISTCHFSLSESHTHGNKVPLPC